MNCLSIKDFELLTQIGGGTYAKVVLAKCIKDKKLYALKILNKKHILQRGQQHHIMTQKQILSEIEHPFLIKLYCAFQDERKLYFVLEYCPGGQLFNLLSLKDRLTEDQTKFYAAQIILALQELHNHKIIYRDLKPENIIIDKNGYLKLTDFGLSKILDSEEGVAMSICGTPEYLAPQMIKKTGYRMVVDWWSLGCLIFEMLTGQPPFRSEKRAELYELIMSKPADLSKVLCLHLQKLSPRAQDLLKKLLEKDACKRLGYKGVWQIKEHVWFDRINWEAVKKQKIKPPFVPKLSNQTDTTNFDTEFTKAPILANDQFNDSELQDKGEFDGFSFNDKERN